MRLYLDQMLRADLADLLRAEGHDVLRTSDVGQARASDDQVLSKAVDEDRVLITLDEHFGDWTILPLSRHAGVIRLKVHPPTSAALASRLIPILHDCKAETLRNQLVIVGPQRERWVRTDET
jgi:predicted nuclease of predicted toxin-antitoxin system